MIQESKIVKSRSYRQKQSYVLILQTPASIEQVHPNTSNTGVYWRILLKTVSPYGTMPQEPWYAH